MLHLNAPSIRVLALPLLLLTACGVRAADAAPQEAQGLEGTSTEKKKPEGGQFCGGFAAIECPEGLVCVDDPNDTCDPATGGADCGGICEAAPKEKKPKCDDKDPHRTYVATDPETCAVIRYTCEADQVAFSDACGCGCETVPTR